MKKAFKVILIVSTISFAACNDEGNSPSQVKPAATATPSPTPTEAEKAQTYENNQLQCLRDVCGDENQYLATRAEGPFGKLIPKDVKEFLDTEVKARTEKIAAASLDEAQAKADFVGNYFTANHISDMSQKEFGWLLVNTIFNRLQPFLNAATESDGQYQVINFDKIPSTEVSDSPDLFRQAVTFYNGLLRSKTYLMALDMPQASFGRYKAVFSGKEVSQEGWEKHINKRLFEMESLKKEFGEQLFSLKETELVKKAAKGELDKAEQFFFITTMTKVLYMSSLQDPAVEQAAESMHPTDDFLRLVDWRKQYTAINEYIESGKSSNKFNEEIFSACSEAIVQAIAAVPSPLKLKRAEQLLEGVKVAAKAATKEYLSGKALTDAQATIDKVTFDIPKSGSGLKAEINSGLGLLAEYWVDTKAVYNSDDRKGQTITFISALSTLSTTPEAAISTVMKNSCKGLKPALFDDHATNGLKVHIGWEAASFHQIGAGVIAHEVGHIVSSSANLLNSKEDIYWKTRECSTQQHKDLSEGKSTNASQYQEEDWADSFAATTLKILNKTWPYGKNYACALTSITQDGKYSQNVISLDSADSHSTGFYRALQTHVAMGNKLPESCKTTLGDKNFEIVSRTCAK